MPRDWRYAREDPEDDEDLPEVTGRQPTTAGEREVVRSTAAGPADEGDDEAEGEDDYLSLAIRTARIVLAGLEARQAGDDEEATRALKQYDRLWPRLAGLVEDAEQAAEGDHAES